MKTDKRVPTVADRFIARKFGRHDLMLSNVTDKLQARARQARKFIFDERAVERVAHVVRTIPELLVREQQFARQPFDLMWLEYPHWRYWQRLVEGRPDEISKLQDDTSDHTIAYLFDHNRVNVIAAGTLAEPMHAPELMPLQYTLHTEWPLQDQIDLAERAKTSRAQLDRYLWGTSFLDIGEDAIRSLRSHHRLDMLPVRDELRAWPTMLLLQGGAGDLRTIIAMLLMLNRPTITRYVFDHPTVRGWHKGHVIPYHAHTTVTIDLDDAVQTLRLMGTPEGEAVPRRVHEVQAHYRHDAVAHTAARLHCVHEWGSVHEDWSPWANPPGDDCKHWVCDTCHGKRWRVKQYTRGDALRGVVTHDYEVVA